ncbi:MAG: hypothetical protein HQL53_06245 [Magnetococcales bacterium]|nr:hypothetical protein [Magnetococcales bacterium]
MKRIKYVLEVFRNSMEHDDVFHSSYSSFSPFVSLEKGQEITLCGFRHEEDYSKCSGDTLLIKVIEHYVEKGEDHDTLKTIIVGDLIAFTRKDEHDASSFPGTHHAKPAKYITNFADIDEDGKETIFETYINESPMHVSKGNAVWVFGVEGVDDPEYMDSKTPLCYRINHKILEVEDYIVQETTVYGDSEHLSWLVDENGKSLAEMILGMVEECHAEE